MIVNIFALYRTVNQRTQKDCATRLNIQIDLWYNICNRKSLGEW